MVLKQRYNIMLNPNIVLILDELACKLSSSRSELIGDILSSYIIESNLNLEFSVNEIPGQEGYLD